LSDVFDIEQLRAALDSTRRYKEFLRVPAMSAGLYVLQPGATDQQKPHKEDEIYYVVRGSAKVRIGDNEQVARQGSVIFVAAEVEHRFFDITEELVLLVVFAPAESA
jgi:quercetin dioxygenase-like cupin family protein